MLACAARASSSPVTGTDCIAVAAPLSGEPAQFAGKHTALGEAIGDAVYRATAEGIREWRVDFDEMQARIGRQTAARGQSLVAAVDVFLRRTRLEDARVGVPFAHLEHVFVDDALGDVQSVLQSLPSDNFRICARTIRWPRISPTTSIRRSVNWSSLPFGPSMRRLRRNVRLRGMFSSLFAFSELHQ